MIKSTIELTHFSNPKTNKAQEYPESFKQILNINDTQQVYDDISQWPGYATTPLHSLTGIAQQLNLKTLWYKDEASRFGLGSFKALGGAYAVFIVLKKIIEKSTSDHVTVEDIIAQKYEHLLSDVVVSCATDGNHGRSVAWGAKLFSCRCIIYIHRDVSTGREQAINALGARVIRVSGNYDDSVKVAAADALEHNRIIVSDTSYEGYTEIPKLVSLGYTVMLRETIEQLQGQIPTHVFLQGGVGGLAATVCAYFWQFWAKQRPRIIIVEPINANCLQKSAQAGAPVIVTGDLDTMMAGLACGEVSLIAWQILEVGCDDFVTMDDSSIGTCMKLLAKGDYGDPKIVAGESAVAGLAATIGLSQSEKFRADLALDQNSNILVFGTEGNTDPLLYQQIIDS